MRKHNSTATLLALAVLVASAALAVAMGSTGWHLDEITLGIRLPRVCVAALVGAALGVAGAVSQGYFRNPLANPSLLGTEAGAVLAAIGGFLAMQSFALDSPAALFFVPCAAVIGALAVTLIILASSRIFAQNPVQLLLIGVILNSWFLAVASFLTALALEDYQRGNAVMQWIMGSLSGRTYEHLWLALPLAFVGGGFAWRAALRLDVLALGAESAQALGIDLRRLETHVIIASALLVGAAVSAAGAMPFVGLIVPHISRQIVGPQQRGLVVFSAVIGATLVIICDLIARLIAGPKELEVGIVTAFIGAPFFLRLLFAARKNEAHT